MDLIEKAEKMHIARDKEACVKSRLLHAAGFFGDSGQICFSCFFGNQPDEFIGYENEEIDMAVDRMNAYLNGQPSVKPDFKYWHDQLTHATPQEMSARIHAEVQSIYSPELQRYLADCFPLTTDTELGRHLMEVVKDCQEDPFFLKQFFADALFERKLSADQFAALCALAPETKPFAIDKKAKNWSGFFYFDGSDWQDYKNAFFPMIFNKRQELICQKKAVTPIVKASYPHMDRNAAGEFRSVLEQAYSSELRIIALDILAAPVQPLSDEQAERGKTLLESMPEKERGALEPILSMWM
jgi:hypothetical protein